MALHVSANPFTIQPPDDLLAQYPSLIPLSRSLSNRHANSEVVTDDILQQMGQALWQALEIDSEFQTAHDAAKPDILAIQLLSDNPNIQLLPWETLYHPELGFLGRDGAFTFSRSTKRTAQRPPVLAKGPLKVLIFTTLPDDEGVRLDVEDEQAQLLEAFLPYEQQGLVQLLMPDDGRFATLQSLLRDEQPQLLFLSGHGKFVIDPTGQREAEAIFQFEKDDGSSEFVAEQALAAIFAGTGVQCVVLSGCESGKSSSAALNDGLSWRLAAAAIPHVVGMRESILDVAGTQFARTFCDAIAKQERVDVALQKARLAIQTPLAGYYRLSAAAPGLAEVSLGQWSLPTLISPKPGQPLLNWDFEPKERLVQMYQNKINDVVLPARFLGRRSELRRLQQRWGAGKLSQLLLTGPGGQGKTALAGKLAQSWVKEGYNLFAYSARPAHSFADFVFELELTLNGQSAEAYSRMLPADHSEADKAKLLLRLLLRQAAGKLLLFFDNLESIQDITSLKLADETVQIWLTAAQDLKGQGLRLILTSRWQLPAWPDADHWALKRPGYNDFLAMAWQLVREGKLSGHFLQARDRLRQLYHALNGNGRGLTFFAAALQTLTDQEGDAFLVAVSEAQQELQADMAIEAVYRQLPENSRQLLHSMTVYQTPVPWEGLVKVMPELSAQVDDLQRLLELSTLEIFENERYLVREYQLSELVRAWLLENKHTAVADELWQKAAQFQKWLYYNERGNLAQAVVVHQSLRQARLNDEADRFVLDRIVGPLNRAGLYRTLLDEWLTRPSKSDDLQIKGEAIGQIGKQHHHLAAYNSALNFFQQSLKISQEIGDKSGEGTTLNNISQIFKARGDYDTALSFLQQSLKISQEIGDKSGEGTTLNNISQIFKARGDYDSALSFLQQSLKISQEIGDKSGEGTTLNNISQIYDARGDYDTALSFLQQSLKIRQEIGDKSGEGTTLNNISQIFKARGDYDTALSFLQQSLKIRQEIGDKSGEGTTLNNISQIYDARGDYDTALSFLQQSLKISQEIGDKSGEGTTLNNMATTAYARGDYDTALSFLQQSLKIRQEIGDKSGEGTTLNNISQIFKARGDYDTALSFLQQSLKIRQEIGDKSGEGTTLNNISQIFKARGDYDTALSFLQQSLKIRQEIGDKSGEGTTLNNISQIYDARGDYDTALSFLQQSLKILQEIGDKSGEGTTLNNISQIYSARGDYDTALSFLQQSLKIRQEIGDIAGLCATLFNMGHIYHQNEQIKEAVSAWVTVYELAAPRNLAQALGALEALAPQLGLEGGLAGWAALAARQRQQE